MLGIALGVAALIIVLSVMNGFQKEVRDRMLSVVSHIEMFAPGAARLPDWQAPAAGARQNPRRDRRAPFVRRRPCWRAARHARRAGARHRPGEEPRSPTLAAQLRDTCCAPAAGRVRRGAGRRAGAQLGVRVGDKVTLIAPSGQVTPAGVVPRLKQFTVAGTFDSGHYEYDSGLALMHLDDAARLFRTRRPDRRAAAPGGPAPGARAWPPSWPPLGADLLVRDWTRTNRNWFDAVQVEKRMMFIILTLIVAVAAFNLVSTLVMTVTDKRADIAILRTLGASPRSVMGIFVVQGAGRA
jgi:lipoprotein-releasing system permease protein